MRKLKAVTLAELTVAMVILALIALAAVQALKPKDIKEDAMHKAGRIVYDELSVVTTDLATRYSKVGDLSKLYTVDKSSQFEITDSGAITKLLNLYKSRMKISRNASSMTYSGYSGNYKLKNGSFFAMKLYGNCTTTTTTYNPMYNNEAMYEYDTCGAIFYDVNDNELPNTLGLDRYIIAFDKHGLR